MCWTLDAHDVSAARNARKTVTAAIGSFTNSKESLDAAELVVGELLSNAARHADGYVCVELTAVEGHAQISVHDSSSAFVLDVTRPPDDYAESGRGLFIISALARRITVVPLGGLGKRVSVMLDVPVADETTLQPSCARPWLRDHGGVCMKPRISRYHPELLARRSANP